MPKGSWREFDEDKASSQNFNNLSVIPKLDRKVRVQRVKAGKGGKTVTLIRGLELQKNEARLLLKSLKANCGTGGTVKGDSLELQGDQVHLVIELLKKEGFCPKQSGS